MFAVWMLTQSFPNGSLTTRPEMTLKVQKADILR
jgi:hypothetical protein